MNFSYIPNRFQRVLHSNLSARIVLHLRAASIEHGSPILSAPKFLITKETHCDAEGTIEEEAASEDPQSPFAPVSDGLSQVLNSGN